VTLFVANRWLCVPLGIVALVLGTFTPRWLNFVYGHANLLVPVPNLDQPLIREVGP
jgi:hypothetical protein